MSWDGPNEHGVYCKDHAEKIAFGDGWSLYASAYLLEIEPGKWVCGYDYRHSTGGGDVGGGGGAYIRARLADQPPEGDPDGRWRR